MEQARVQRVVERMKAQGLTQVLVTATASVYYLTGFWVEPHERMLALWLDDQGQAVLFGNEIFGLPSTPELPLVTHTDSQDPVAALAAGVLGTTGMESGELVRAVAETLRPACVIAVDALASRSLHRVCTTVQLSDTGIVPGSGVGNHRYALDRETLGVPVIAVGVPTVVDGATLALDILEEAGRTDLDPAALRGIGGDLMVTPRDIDQRVKDMAKVIGYGIDLALHPGLTLEDVELFLS